PADQTGADRVRADPVHPRVAGAPHPPRHAVQHRTADRQHRAGEPQRGQPARALRAAHGRLHAHAAADRAPVRAGVPPLPHGPGPTDGDLTMASLHIEHLGKQYGAARGTAGAWALRDFSLEVGDGELVAIVGPSGCGKSALLRMVAGVETETTGTMRLGDRVLNGLAPRDRDVALMFQSYTLLPHLTIAENLAFGLKLRGVARAERMRKARAARSEEHTSELQSRE